jgi:hypothetical protein
MRFEVFLMRCIVRRRLQGPPRRQNSGVHPGVHNPRTLRPSSDSSDAGKGNELAKSFIRRSFPAALKSPGPLVHVGSTPTPGTTLSAAS